VSWLGVLLLLVTALTGLVLIPLGLPGLWVMVLGVIGYGWLTGFEAVGVGTIALVVAIAMVGELVEAWLGFRAARRYGGSRRAGWGAVIGGIAGAIVGVPVPIVGSVIGAFVGAFAGAAAFEYLGTPSLDGAARAGWGAVLGRALGAAVKVALGVVIAVIGVAAVLRS
jgi:uncharacterized protein